MSDFDIPPSRPKASRPVPSTPPKPATPEKNLASEAETTVAAKTPEAPTYSEEELLRVFDEIIFSGEYEESYTVKGRLQVTLRTRTAKEINDIQAQLDSSMLNMVSTLEQKRSYLNLQYALKSFHGKDLGVLKLEDRIAIIEKIPGPVIYAILDCLAKFDNKVFLACKDGEVNF